MQLLLLLLSLMSSANGIDLSPLITQAFNFAEHGPGVKESGPMATSAPLAPIKGVANEPILCALARYIALGE